jgi:hypothetical protein
MRRLFDSLMRNYPIQIFLFWRTKDFIKVREFMTCVDWDIDLHDLYNDQKSAQGVEKVFVLDGQQRLQTLYALFNGQIAGDGPTAKREAFVDLTAGESANEDGLIFDIKFASSPLPLPHYRLRLLMENDSSRNLRKRAEMPSDYFTRLKKAGVPIENHLLLPEFASDPSLLKFDVETYNDFRNRRRAAIFAILKRAIDPEVPASA